MNETEQNTELMVNEIKELKAKIEKLEADIEDIKFFAPTPSPVVNKEIIGQVGGMILGALVIIGIFW